MDNEKIDEVKEIVERGQQTKDNRKPRGIKSSIPASYLSQGNADICRGYKHIPDNPTTKEQKEEQGPEMGR